MSTATAYVLLVTAFSEKYSVSLLLLSTWLLVMGYFKNRIFSRAYNRKPAMKWQNTLSDDKYCHTKEKAYGT